jgi:hypothetical protein
VQLVSLDASRKIWTTYTPIKPNKDVTALQIPINNGLTLAVHDLLLYSPSFAIHPQLLESAAASLGGYYKKEPPKFDPSMKLLSDTEPIYWIMMKLDSLGLLSRALNYTDDNGFTPLMAAAYYGNVLAVRFSLSHSPPSVQLDSALFLTEVHLQDSPA